jgi:hypothetical protein
LQSYQPTIQGAEVTDAIYIHRLSKERIGFQSRKYTYDSQSDTLTKTESWFSRDNFQLNVLLEEDVSDTNAQTSLDVIKGCLFIMQSLEWVQALKEECVGIFRIPQIVVNYIDDDHGEYYKDDLLEFSLTYEESFDLEVIQADINGQVVLIDD